MAGLFPIVATMRCAVQTRASETFPCICGHAPVPLLPGGFHARMRCMSKEIEATLVVVHDEPQRILEKVSALRSLGPYRFSPGVVLTLEDTYYDTPSRLLSSRGIAVRIRHVGELHLFCIKHDEHVDVAGTASRDEMETPWSRQCMDHLLPVLHKLQGGICEVPPESCSPGECLACLGLTALQERETTRILKDASLPGGPCSGPVAELALDRVSYAIGSCRILHYEIEVEARTADASTFVREISTLLSSRFGDTLQTWRYNKLTTGFAIERLVSGNSLSLRPGTCTCLARADYDLIDAVLKHP